ncbi:MAG TPA: DUF502 domain-containing protein [Verrucomicrobiae bacterium]|nr:DUF502 domain-containing protein [Verrucomicrobiae bacterium]
MRRLARTFLSGLAVVLPIVVTIAVLAWLVRMTETALGAFVRVLLPDEFYAPGLGLLVALGLVFAVGVLMEAVYFRRLMRWFEALLERIPLVKTVYSAVRDLMSLFSQSGSNKFSKVVMVKFPGTEAGLLGFVTIEDFSGLPLTPAEGTVAVYLPMSYTIGGYTALLPRAWLTPVDMTLEEAMRFVVTAGMSRSS